MSQEDVDEQNARKEAHGAVSAADITAATAGLYDDRGDFDASGNAFPSTGGSGEDGRILQGDVWTVSVPGILGGHAVNIDDTVRAEIDDPTDDPAGYGWAIESETPDVRTISGTTSTITQADNGKLIRFTGGTAHTCTVTGPFASGFQCLIVQGGAGQITFAAAGGATISNRQGHTKTQGTLWAEVSLASFHTSDLILAGDTGS